MTESKILSYTEDKIRGKIDKGHFNFACYYLFLKKKIENAPSLQIKMSHAKTLRNVDSKTCPQCGSNKKQSEPLASGDDYLSFGVKCSECSLLYSGFKIPRTFYSEVVSVPVKEFLNEGKLVELIQFLKEEYRNKSNPIKQAYYRDWEKRIIDSIDREKASNITYNWRKVCTNCFSYKSNILQLDKKEKIDGVSYINYDYNCGRCGIKLGKIRISKPSMTENTNSEITETFNNN